MATALKGIYRAIDAEAGEAALTASTRASGDAAIAQSARAGGAPGAKSCHHTPSPARSAGFSTQRHQGSELETAPDGSNQGHLPTDKAAMKLIFLVLNRLREGVEEAACE